MKTINNIDILLKDELIEKITKDTIVSVVANNFSIFAYKPLKKVLNNCKEFRFIFTNALFKDENKNKKQKIFSIKNTNIEADLCGSEFELNLNNHLNQSSIARDCVHFIKNKCKFKLDTSIKQQNGFILLNDKEVYFPINGFTAVDLGLEDGNVKNTVIVNLDDDASIQDFKVNFDNLWASSDVSDVTDIVIDSIANAFKENSPEFLYFLTLDNIFVEFKDDLNEDNKEREIGFKESLIFNKLYDFQKDAVLAIIHKLYKYQGCILADSVGLGKTFTALAVIKYFESRNSKVLVLCPKKLGENWLTYNSNYKSNILSEDRLNYDVFYHTDLSRERGFSNGKDLNNIYWSNYDLVVIDESHNFRNGGKFAENDNDKENRYIKLLNKVIKNGVKTKVLMLSATPVNNKFADLKNQLLISYEGDSTLADSSLNTNTMFDEVFRQAQKAYNEWSTKKLNERTLDNLLNNLSYDFLSILDSVTIARSRRQIEQFYSIKDIGSFPKKLAPISKSPDMTDKKESITYKEIASLLDSLSLVVYTPSNFILESKKSKYIKNSKKNFFGMEITGRELGIKRLMKINLLKRLESSINSFTTTLDRIHSLIENTIYKIDTFEKNQNLNLDITYNIIDDCSIDDQNDDLLNETLSSNIAIQDMDYIAFREELREDKEVLNILIEMFHEIDVESDTKLNTLYSDIKYKVNHEINKGNKKILIFTAFADTANYIYDSLAHKIKSELNLDVALITGDFKVKNTLNLKRKMDFNLALTLFSPISKSKDILYPDIDAKIDILIGTDCISEGQNLQDCDYLINYDIHWNPVRIIQRFGRIDRIGSKNENIQLVNYWPNINLDEYIKLKDKVEGRMTATVLTSTGDDNPLDKNSNNDVEYRIAQLKRIQKENVNIEEMTSSVSIMDLGLNEYRHDLILYHKENTNLSHNPFGMHALVKAKDGYKEGVIFILKNTNENLKINRKNRLHPFYLTYIANDGQIIMDYMQTKKILDTLRELCKGQDKEELELCQKFNDETSYGEKMSFYSNLLNLTISNIIDVKEKNELDAFLDGSDDILFNNEIKGLKDFQLIHFFVIKK